MNLICLFAALTMSLSAMAAQPDFVTVTFRADVNEQSADQIEAALISIEQNAPKAVLMIIDSPGGSLDAGWRIVQRLQASKIPVHCVVDGMAASMGFVILQACTTRGITPLSKVLAHQPVFVMEGRLHIRDLRSLLYELSAHAEKMAIFCSTRMKMPLADFERNVEGSDWIMGAATALREHAVDYVAPLSKVQSNLSQGKHPGSP